MPAAIGMALAERQLGRHRPVVVVPDKWGYSVLKQFAALEGMAGIPGPDLEGIDIGSIARGYGCAVARAGTPAAVEGAFREAPGRGGPTVLIAPVQTDTARLS